MANALVLGLQWGDEGKGKIVYLICPAFDAVARFQGGNNAGHTVRYSDRHFALHLLPSGILHRGLRCVLAAGMVIEPEAFFTELAQLAEAGIDTGGRVFVSDRAHVILPTHVALDKAREETRGEKRIGTTARGIGPAYEAKASRSGVRIGDLAAADVVDRLRIQHSYIAPQLTAMDADRPARPSAVARLCADWGQRFAPHVCDTTLLLNRWIDEGRRILFEGAQGALLDLDHGTFPYVTSSSTLAGGAATGTGVAPRRLGRVLGVVKAYTTRVGGGPFVTELDDDVGEHLSRRGNEVGTTTGRPRRCGWLDAVAARYAVMTSGADVLALTKLDVLDELEEIRICTGYRYRGSEHRDFPAALADLEEAEPIYRSLPGWRQPTAGILDVQDLPEAARGYVAAIEDEIGAPAGLVSTGPRREETILIDRPEMQRLLSNRLQQIAERRNAA